ncbi:hypothetical protein BGZ47_005141, partial [Haplosporangium gracile]
VLLSVVLPVDEAVAVVPAVVLVAVPRRSSTSVLPPVPPSPTLLILLDPRVSCTLSSSLTALDAILSIWPRSAPTSSPSSRML